MKTYTAIADIHTKENGTGGSPTLKHCRNNITGKS